MESKKEVAKKLNKIWSITNNLAQERRIRSNELDDFNQAFGKLSELIDSLFKAVEMMEKKYSEVEILEIKHANQKQKIKLCLELCGMSKKGIEHMLGFPTKFLEMAMTLRLKANKPLENDIDFYWLDQLWNGINIHIENDLENFKQANLFKKLYHDATNPEIKKRILKVMNGYANDLFYMKSKLGKEIDEKDLLNTITTHWYEEYRNCTTTENS